MARMIDADALRLMTVEECAGHTIEYAAGWKACVDWIKTLPTIDAVPIRHGYWIDRDGQYECSECHNISCCKGKYCTDCGAKMDDSSPTCGPDYCEIGGGDDAR